MAKLRTNKLRELLYRASLQASFQDEIKRFRKQVRIPEEGFRNKEDKNKWVEERDRLFRFPLEQGQIPKINSKPFTLQGYYKDEATILKKYLMPPTSEALTLLDNYIIENDLNVKNDEAINSSFFFIDFPNKREIRKAGSFFVKLYIFAGASQEDVIEYLKKNWKFIQKLLHKRRVRKFSNKERNELIFELYKKSREELGLKRGRRGEYKDRKVSSILKEKYNIEVTPENIRKIVQQQREMREV